MIELKSVTAPAIPTESPQIQKRLADQPSNLQKAMEAVDRATAAIPKANPVDQYGEKYGQLEQDIISSYERMAQHYATTASRYMAAADKLREEGKHAARRHIDDLIKLDKAFDAMGFIETKANGSAS